MTTCCGENRETPFCPMCGARIRRPSPLDELLEYIRKQRAAAVSWLRKAERRAAEAENPARHRTHLQQRRDAVMKWERWVAAVESQMALAQPEGDGNG